MFQKLVSHNDDIKRLVDRGYAIGFDPGYLIVRDIPYLDSELNLQIGAFVTKLVFINGEKVTQDDHQVFFAGSIPYGLDGRPIPNLAGGEHKLPLSEACNDVVVQRTFSNKPKVSGKFIDFFEKIESYVAIIAGPAMERHGATPYTFRNAAAPESDSVFKFCDTLTSRAEIGNLSAKFKEDVVAIIGLGGTGSYILDFLVKTPIQEIRAFDFDSFHVHNAFRSPGRLDEKELGKSKAEVYQSRYENFRTAISAIPKFIDGSTADDLEGVTFAFVCVDKGSSRKEVFDVLIAKEIPFIDVGMGLNDKHGPLGGMLRATYYSVEDAQTVKDKRLAELADSPNDMYRRNIQIAELNAMNACLAVIRFKQLRGFYTEELPYYHLLFGVSDLNIVGESELNENQ
jgi:hypothetical protein